MIEAEQSEEQEVLRERLASWSLDRLQQEGYCITGLSAFWQERQQFGRPVASFFMGPGIMLPSEHRFDNGTQVLVTRLDPLKEEPQRGSIVSTTDSQLRVSFTEKFELDEGIWRLDVGQSNIVYERMRTAIHQLNYDPALQESDASDVSSDRQVILQGTHLRDILLRSFAPEDEDVEVEHEWSDSGFQAESRGATPSPPPLALDGLFKNDARIQSWAKRYSRSSPVIVEGDPVMGAMNDTQIRAVAMMLDNRFTLVQGPPGTGKTKTVIEAVKLLKVHFRVPYPILLCTYTNVAVDNLVEGLVNASLDPVRIGYNGKMKASLLDYSLDVKLSTHELAPEYERSKTKLEAVHKKRRELVKRIMELGQKRSGSLAVRISNMEADAIAMERQISFLKSKTYALYLRMVKDILSRADVVCTTCITSASSSLNVIDFPLVFIDEASMSTEPASLIPLMKGSEHVALIGDHKQLPPVITSPEAQAKGFGISLFERLSEENFLPSIMLDVQYRMHPTISQFPSQEFYNYSLRDGTVDAHGNVPSRLLPPESTVFPETTEPTKRPSVIFLDHVGAESMKDRSRVNWNEAHIVCSLVEDLLKNNEHMQGKDIGIIAPYVAQISLLTRLFNLDVKYKNRFESVLGSQRAMQLADIEIKTVDGFEGREKDVIIFSTVRNNDGGHIGFLADRRRLNVGLTRAKRGLFVVGNISTLKAGKVSRDGEDGVVRVGKGAEAWRRYAAFLSEHNLIVKLSGDRLRKMLYGNFPKGVQVNGYNSIRS
ncbi:hypothetical protein PHLCEN_2v3060 [Hermanssonia centrifuga]|uniref:P-loop containing nucleoside triphosphate hydrolase protein n=1 Tax=Hermanssonia centrifuga TaxID=98765 RepID=A0A2R6R782_9APHY|nr:hypothetical protein PHLCEN_2v3060 [Hermanssonia centrifuga]